MPLQNHFYCEDEAFLIRSTPYGDHHRILSFLTSTQGRIDAIAYAAQSRRKSFSGALDFIHCLKICVKPGNEQRLGNLVSCDLEEDFARVREDYSASITALEWIRLISRAIPQQQKVEGAYFLLKTSLASLGDGSFRKIDLQFRVKFLELLGYRLELSCCCKCFRNDSKEFFFYPEEGGLLCESCAPNFQRQNISPWSVYPDAEFSFDLESYSRLRHILNEAFTYFLDIQFHAKEYRHFPIS